MMKKLLALSLLFVSVGHAQNIRQMGMGGVRLPEQATRYHNPAFYAAPLLGDTSWALPLGLLQANQISMQTTQNATDLAIFDKIWHPFEWGFYGTSTLIPTGSSSNVQVASYVAGWNASRFNQTFVPFEPAFQVAPSWNVEFTPSVRLQVGALKFSDNIWDIGPGGELKPNQIYTSEFHVEYQMTADAGVTYTQVLNADPTGTLQIGLRPRASLGIFRANFNLEDRTVTGPDGKPVDALSSSRVETFMSEQPSFGVHLDAGLLWNNADLSVGLGVRNLVQYMAWQGRYDTYEQGKNTSRAGTFLEPIFAPEVLANVAYQIPEGENKWLLGADVEFGFNRDFGVHLGGEYQSGNVMYRAGLGYQKGFEVGVGAGILLNDFLMLDVALTGHQTQIVRNFVPGIAVGAKIKF